MPGIGDVHHPLHQYPERAVFASFKFITNHTKFTFKIFFCDKRIDHPVCFQIERPFEILIRSGKSLEVIGTVIPSRSIGSSTPFCKFLCNVGMAGSAFKHHMFEQVGHTCLSMPLMAGPYQIGHIYGNGRFGWVREERYPQTIIETIFGNSFNRYYFVYSFWEVLCCCCREGNEENENGAFNFRKKCKYLHIS